MPDVKRKSRPPAEPRPVPFVGPFIRFGRSLFGNHKEELVDGAHNGRHSFHRMPDGSLAGIEHAPKEPKS